MNFLHKFSVSRFCLGELIQYLFHLLPIWPHLITILIPVGNSCECDHYTTMKLDATITVNIVAEI